MLIEAKITFSLVCCVIFAGTIGDAFEKPQSTDMDVETVDKRLLLHNPNDLLGVITSLTAQVRTLNTNQEHVIANLSAQVKALNDSLARKEIQLTAQVETLNINQEQLVDNLLAQVKVLNESLAKKETQLQRHETKLTKLEALLSNQTKTIAELHSKKPRGGSTYVRWGRKSCPVNGTRTVYSGYVGGSMYSDTGAAANYICLSPNPTWDHYTDAVDSLARVYGAEYEFFHGDSNSQRQFFGKSLIDNDVPCSVCETDRSKIIMIPGQNQCNVGWTLEYKGYLSAGAYDHAAASEYVCLDTDPEFTVGGQGNDNGALFYFAEASCGSLECPPYKNGRELTCAVCSK